MLNTLTFVLPFSSIEDSSSASRRWREGGAPPFFERTRLSLLLRTFLRYFQQRDYTAFLIVAPERDIADVEATVRSLTLDSRFRVMDERLICPYLFKGKSQDPIEGWYFQQILKLAMAEHVETTHYVTLDSDIILWKPCGQDDLVISNKAVTNRETFVDYQDLYTDEFAEDECTIKRFRYRQSAKVLGYENVEGVSEEFFGETPVILNSRIVRELIRFIDIQNETCWYMALSRIKGWTEYGLYYQYLRMIGEIDRHCMFGGRNKVLDLERSVWHSNSRYRLKRCYDRNHFRSPHSNLETGSFVAIQSWLNPRGWLPRGIADVSEFYRILPEWLDL